MDENDLQERRRTNLRTWTDAKGGVAASLAGRPPVPASYPSYLSQLLKDYSFGSRAARTCESRLGMPSQWLDQDHNASDAEAFARARPALQSPTLELALPVVLDAISKIPPIRWPSVRAQLDQLSAHPELRDDVVAELLTMLAATLTKHRSAA